MACQECGKVHDVPTSDDEEYEPPHQFNEDSSSEEEQGFLPFPFLTPPQFFQVGGALRDMFGPLLPANPFQLLF